LERVALNLDDSEFPDNRGDIRIGQPIQINGPPAYWSTLPLPQLMAALFACGVPAGISNHAGTFVCNHVFYRSCYEIQQMGLNTRCGLVHVPLMAEQAEVRSGSGPSLPIESMVRAVECCLMALEK
jgi:pyroglutamyl-peptidase